MSRGGRPARPRFRLRGEADGEVFDFVLKSGENRIGAAADNDLVIQIEGVSRKHAVVRFRDDALEVEDLGSKNGTLVNGARVTTALLGVGDVVCFGPAVMRVQPIDASDTEIAIAGSEPTPGAATGAARWKAHESPTDDAVVPGRWLDAVSRLVGSGLGSGTIDVEIVLEVVITALGAQAAAVLAWPSTGPASVLHTVGGLGPEWLGEELLHGLEAGAGAGRHAPPGATFTLGDGVWATCATGGKPGPGRRTLVVFADFPAREHAVPFLQLVLQLALAGDAGLPDGEPLASRRPVPELVFPEGYVVGGSPAILSVYRQLRHLLSGDIPILISGETGVGKEHIARILHASSARAAGPFEAVNCAAVPSELLEAELFGIEAGVATGVTRRDGRMVLARGGTVFLDEIGDMSPALQAKLLRALQEREVRPIGSRHPTLLDIRVLAATNADLQERIAAGRFRADLYYRIAGYTIEVPPLRSRAEDIPSFAEHFMKRFVADAGKPGRGITTKALRALVAAPWPGNVRELEHEVRRLVYLCPEGQPITSEILSPAVLAPAQRTAVTADGDLTLGPRVDDLERTMIMLALARAHGRQAAAARLLGISRYGLRLKIQRLGITEA